MGMPEEKKRINAVIDIHVHNNYGFRLWDI